MIENVSLNVQLPKIIEVADYHDFDNITNVLKMIGINLYVEEVGFNFFYIGVIHDGSENQLKEVEKIKNQYKEES